MQRRAFTLVELLVVISIIVIGAILLVPAFGRIVASANYSGAINSVSATLSAARTLAVREQRHTAVAFLWDEESETVSLQILIEQAGLGAAITQFPSSGSLNDANAFAYRPADGQVPVILPKGVLVYGLSYATDPSNTQLDPETPGWYAGHLVTNDAGELEPMWLFPRNDPSWATPVRGTAPPFDTIGIDPWDDRASGSPRLTDAEFREAVRSAQTFCIQYSPEGTVVNSPRAGGISTNNAYIEFADGPLDLDNRALGSYDNDLLFDPETALSATDPEPNREIFMRSATQLAIVELPRLRETFAVAKPWHAYPRNATTPRPAWWDFPSFDNDRVRDLQRWIDSNAEILGFNRYTGQMLRRTER